MNKRNGKFICHISANLLEPRSWLFFTSADKYKREEEGRQKVIDAAEEYSELIRTRWLHVLDERVNIGQQHQQLKKDRPTTSKNVAKDSSALKVKDAQLQHELGHLHKKRELANSVLTGVYSLEP